MKRLVGTCAAIISVVAPAACGSGNVGAGPTALRAPWALSTVNRPNLASGSMASTQLVIWGTLRWSADRANLGADRQALPWRRADR